MNYRNTQHKERNETVPAPRSSAHRLSWVRFGERSGEVARQEDWRVDRTKIGSWAGSALGTLIPPDAGAAGSGPSDVEHSDFCSAVKKIDSHAK